MIRAIRKILRRSDIYGYPITLNFSNDTKFRTATGGLFSLITVIIIISLTYRGAVSLFSRENDQVQVQKIVAFQPDAQQIRFTDFTFFVRAMLKGHENLKYQRQLFNITISQVLNGQSQNEVTKPLQWELCESIKLQDLNSLNFSQQFDTLKLSQSICPMLNQNFTLNAYLNHYIQISINQCLDVSQCYSYEELEDMRKQLNQGYFKIQFGFTNTYLDTQTSTIKPFLYETFFLINIEKDYVTSQVYVEKTTFKQDNSIIPYQSQFSETFFYSVPQTNIQTQSLFRSLEQTQYADINIQVSQIETVVSKRFDKLDTYLAYVGGILQTSIFLMSVVFGGYNMFGFYVSLANKLYTFDIKPSKMQKYQRQHLNLNASQILSLDQIATRIQDRIINVHQGVLRFQRCASVIQKYSSFASRFSTKRNFDNEKDEKDKSEEKLDSVDQIDIEALENPENSNKTPVSESPVIDSEASIQLLRETKFKVRMQRRVDKLKKDRHPKKVPSEKSKQTLAGILGYESRQDFVQHGIEDILKYTKHIKMSMIYLLNKILCKKLLFKTNEQNLLLERAVDMLRKDTDIATILFKLQDIDKLKRILMTRDQILLFDYSPKPVVTAEYNHQTKLSFKNDTIIDVHRGRRQNILEIEQDIQLFSRHHHKKQSLLQNKHRFDSVKSFMRLYHAFDRLFQLKDKLTKQELKMNSKLMHLLGAELHGVFETSYLLEERRLKEGSKPTSYFPKQQTINQQRPNNVVKI